MSSFKTSSSLLFLAFMLIITAAVLILFRHCNSRKNEEIMNLVSQRVTGGMLLPLVSPFAIPRKATDRLLENKGRDGPDHDDHDKKTPRDPPFPFFMSLEIQDSQMSKICYLLSLVREELSNYAEALSPYVYLCRGSLLKMIYLELRLFFFNSPRLMSSRAFCSLYNSQTWIVTRFQRVQF